ncbi:MAG: alpha-L-rhamnosidase C-terminal domain-containing protein [Lachnospiraceae bacterium]
MFAEIYEGEIYDARLEDPVLWKTVRVLDTNYRNLYPQSGGTVQKMDALQAIKIWKIQKGEQVVSYPGMLEMDDICAYAVHTNMKETGRFTCANPDVNQLQHNIKWGLKGNFVDVPTDCPQRDERLGWTGDAQIFCRTATYLMDTYTFFGKWLKDLAADQTSEGGVPHVVPDIITGKGDNNWLVKQGTYSAAAWADAAVINPWVLYQTYGDKRILEEQYHSMKAWIDFMKVHAKDYIWNYQLQFGDWVALDAEPGSYFGATPNDLTCTAYYAYSTRLFAEVAKALDKFKEYQEYSQLAEKIVNKFQSTFFDAQGTLYAQTQTAHILALYFDLTPEEWKERTIQGLLRLLEKEKGHLVTGFVGTPYFCHALSENGHTKEAYDLLLKEDFPSWLYQVKMGATTIWEHWDGIKEDGSMWSPDMNSFNHYAYGAIGEWLYRVAAGIEIDQEQPGYKHGILYPHPDQRLQSVSASYETVYGKLGIMWKLENKMFQIEAEIPVNTTATIVLEKEWEVVESKGLVFKEDDGVQKAWCGSGKYWVVGKAK